MPGVRSVEAVGAGVEVVVAVVAAAEAAEAVVRSAAEAEAAPSAPSAEAAVEAARPKLKATIPSSSESPNTSSNALRSAMTAGGTSNRGSGGSIAVADAT